MDIVKLGYAVIHLEGDTFQWHQLYMKMRSLSMVELSWMEYVRAIMTRISDALL